MVSPMKNNAEHPLSLGSSHPQSIVYLCGQTLHQEKVGAMEHVSARGRTFQYPHPCPCNNGHFPWLRDFSSRSEIKVLVERNSNLSVHNEQQKTWMQLAVYSNIVSRTVFLSSDFCDNWGLAWQRELVFRLLLATAVLHKCHWLNWHQEMNTMGGKVTIK